MDTSIFKSHKAGYTLLNCFCFAFLLCFGILQETEAQALESEAKAVEEATNPAGQVPGGDIPDDPESVTHGKQLFGQHCNVCHMVDKQLIGPALASVHNRRPIPWLMDFIRNSQAIIDDPDDEYAQHLFNEYNKVVMPSFEFLSDEDIYSILAYIKAESVSPTTAGGVNGTNQEGVTRPQDEYNSDGDEAYSQKDGNAVEVRGQTPSSFSIGRYLMFGLSIVVVSVIFYYVVKGIRKTRTKENA